WFAYGINNAGQVVGAGPNGAVLWENGVTQELRSLIPANPDWHLFAATAINEQGQIVALGSVGGQPPGHAILLTPLPAAAVRVEPTSLSFGRQIVGSVSDARAVQITNGDGAPLTI